VTYLGTPYHLFHNLGNDNHWLQVELEGVISNRDGIGAKVYITAGGITQLREQSGGIHTTAQNQQRLHFGLGNNEVVEKLRIEWPSGAVQESYNLPANQILNMVENQGTEGIDVLIGTSGNDIFIGFRGADILTGNGGSDEFIYNDFADRGDRILDFNPLDDFIDLSPLFADQSLYSSLTPYQSYVKLVQKKEDTQVQINPVGDAKPNLFRTLLTLEGVMATDLSASNFILTAADLNAINSIV
jgi:Ca2+-binding RTX toxin-like protein